MFVWAILLGGPLVLPLAAFFRADLPSALVDATTLVGALTLFLAICATEAVGSGEKPRARPAGE